MLISKDPHHRIKMFLLKYLVQGYTIESANIKIDEPKFILTPE